MNIGYYGVYTENAVNGVDVTGYIVAKEIVKLGHQVYCYSIGNKDEQYEDNGIKIRIFKREGKFSLPQTLKNHLSKNEDNIDVFHLRSVFIFANYLVAKYLHRCKLPYVITPHGGYDEHIMKRSRLKKKLYFQLFESQYLHNAKGAISCSGESEIRDFERLKYKGISEIIWDPVYTDKVYQPKNNKKLVFLGRYDMDHKGLDHLLHLFAEILKLDPEYSLDLYGSGPHKEELMQLKNALGLSNTTINGPVYENEKDEIMANCNAYIQTSRWEAFGRSIMEAIAQGLPVIISEGCNLKDTIAGKNLGLVVNYDYKSSAKKIVDYLADHTALLEISKNNVLFSRHEYEPTINAKQNVEFYQRIMNS